MNPGIDGFLARERERDLARRARAAAPAHLAHGDGRQGGDRHRRGWHPARRVGTWTGLLMVRAGQRLAGIEVLAPRPPHLQRPA
jgi:hypothetical protein